MSPRSARVVVVIAALAALVLLGLGCGSSPPPSKKGRSKSKEPQTAREKQMQEAKASGELDGPQPKWGKWRYTGDRADCFYVVGQRCFKTEKAACTAARCKTGQRCKSTGAGPATIACAK